MSFVIPREGVERGRVAIGEHIERPDCDPERGS